MVLKVGRVRWMAVVLALTEYLAAADPLARNVTAAIESRERGHAQLRPLQQSFLELD